MCKCLKISESGYYRWLKNKSKPSSRQLLSVEIQKIIDEHPDNDNYGVLRMRIALEQNGITVSKRTVSRAMSGMGLLHKRRKPHGITKATTEIQERENLIRRDFSANMSLKKWFQTLPKYNAATVNYMFQQCLTASMARYSHLLWMTI